MEKMKKGEEEEEKQQACGNLKNGLLYVNGFY